MLCLRLDDQRLHTTGLLMEREEQGCIVVASMSVGKSGVAPSLLLHSFTQAYLELAYCVLHRVRLDHMIMIKLILQDHLVEMMAKRCLSRHLCIFEHPKSAQPMRKADLHDYHLNRRSGRRGLVCCCQRRCRAAYPSTVVGEEASKKPCHILRGWPILRCG